jgi:translocation and assembly module TamB
VKRILRILGLILVVLAIVLALAWWWLTATTSGARWVLGQAQSRVETLVWEDAQGGLMTGLTLTGVRFGQAGLAVTADRLEVELAVGVMPLRAGVERLHVDNAEVVLPPPADEPAPAEPFEPGDWRAPLPIVVDDVVVDGLAIRAAAPAEPTRIQRIELAGRYDQRLVLDRLDLAMRPYAVSLSGGVGMSRPWSSDLQATLEWRLADDVSQRLEATVRGPLDDLAVDLAGRGPLTAEASAELRGLPDVDALQAGLDVSGGLTGWPGLAGSLQDVRLSAEGAPADWTAELDGRVDWPDQPVVDASLAADGSTDAIRITRGRFALLDGEVRLTGRAELGDPVTADAAVAIDGLDFTALYPEWPDQAAVSGSLDAAWDGRRLDVRSLTLRAPPAPLSVDGSAGLDVEQRALDVALNWSRLTWPPVTDGREPMISSESGRLEASGTLDEWRAEIEAWLQAPDQPRARVELEADGDAGQANLRSGRVRLEGAGAAELSGRVGWTGGPSAALDLALDGLDPGALVPQLPGRVDGRAALSLSSLEPMTLGLDIAELGGQLRGQPLAGSGALQVVGDGVEQADLSISLGANRVGITTADGTRWRIELAAERLAQLWPGLSGALTGSATVDPAARRAEWVLESSGMGWQGRRLARLESDGSAGWGDQPSVDATLRAADVDLNPWERLDTFRLALSGNCRAHTLTTSFSGARTGLDLELGGELPGCLQFDRGWSGAVRRMRFSDTPLGDWQLDQNLPLAWRDGVLRAGQACLWTPSAPGRLCLNELEAGAQGSATVAFNSVPLDLLLLPADPVFRLGTPLRGTARFGWDADGARDIDAELRLGPGAARLLGSDEDLVVIRGARLSVDSPDARALNAELALRLEGDSELIARSVIPDLTAPADLRLDATADLRLPNLGVFNRLVPQLDDLGGALEGEFAVRGPISGPDFDGRIAIRDGRFFHAPLGSRVEDLALVVEGDQTGGDLRGSFRAGEGRAEVGGRFDQLEAADWRARIEIDGDRLALFNAEWLEMTASPALALAYSPDRVELDGRLRIDRARLGLPPGSEQRVAASSDVVVAGRDDENGDNDAPAPRDIVGNVMLELGDDVRLNAAGMQTRIAGGLDIQWAERRVMPSADGRLELVDGAYSAYGQNLEVTEGDVLFTGNPIDNPVLQIEAVRTIFGDPQVEAAGVRIAGPARDPEITLFTDPPTSREKALAYIVTGAEFDHAAGQGAFNVGFWVLPRLFVSYGLGLFDSGNVLAARYDLSKRWGIRATSGERDTGVDVSFIIDR